MTPDPVSLLKTKKSFTCFQMRVCLRKEVLSQATCTGGFCVPYGAMVFVLCNAIPRLLLACGLLYCCLQTRKEAFEQRKQELAALGLGQDGRPITKQEDKEKKSRGKVGKAQRSIG